MTKDKDIPGLETPAPDAIPEIPAITGRPAEAEVRAPQTITEKQQETLPDGMKWLFEFSAPRSRFIILDLEAEWDYKQHNWHFIPYTINEDHRKEYGGHTVLFRILCVDDKAARRRLEKKLRKWVKGPIAWLDAQAEAPADFMGDEIPEP